MRIAASGAHMFCDWIGDLLRHYDLVLPNHDEQEVYTLHFDGKPSVHFVKTPQGEHVDVLVEAGTLPVIRAADRLLRLLALNACHSCDYTIAVSVQEPSGAVLLWSRQRWRALDLEATQKLLQAVLEKADAVRRELRRQEARPAVRGGALGRMPSGALSTGRSIVEGA